MTDESRYDNIHGDEDILSDAYEDLQEQRYYEGADEE